MTISGGRTEQLVTFCCVTGFTSDFLSFLVVEHIRFFLGVLQLCGIRKPIWWGYKAEKKFDDIFIHFDTIPRL